MSLKQFCSTGIALVLLMMTGIIQPEPVGGTLPLELDTHDPIRIENSTHLTSVAENLSIPGNGTEENPYVIEGLDIDGGGRTPCISVNNTREHILIINCSLKNGGERYYGNFFPRSLSTYRAANVRIINCSIDTIRIYQSDHCTLDRVSWQANNGTLLDNYYGRGLRLKNVNFSGGRFYSRFSDDVIISECDVLGGTISLNRGNYNIGKTIVKDCRFSGNEDILHSLQVSSERNLHLYSCDFRNTFPGFSYYNPEMRNTIVIPGNNTVDGSPLIFRNGENLSGDTVPPNGGYYLFMDCENIALSEINMTDHRAGMTFMDSVNLSLTEIYMSDMDHRGIEISSCDNVAIKDIEMVDLFRGLVVEGVMDISITGSTFSDCNNGTYLFRGSVEAKNNITVSECDFSACDTGLNVNYVSNAEVTDSSFIKCNQGASFQNSNDARVHENLFRNCTGPAVITGFACSENIIWWNRFIKNNENGTTQVMDSNEQNLWHNPSLLEGNLWSDHKGPDSDRDGIVDDPYVIVDGKALDQKPLVSQPGIPLSPPVNISVSVENEEAVLSWEMPSVERSPVITDFRILRNSSSGTTNRSVGSQARSFRDTETVFGNQYTYRVQAMNKHSSSPLSKSVSTFIFNRPRPPANFTFTCLRDHLNLSWKKPADNGGTPIIGYRVYRSTSPIVWAFIGETNETFFLDDEIDIGSEYYYFVSAVNMIGEGELSDHFQARALTFPDPPTLRIGSTGDDHIEIEWEEPSFKGGYPITDYRIYRGREPDELSAIEDVGSNERSYNDTGLLLDEKYFYAVTALNGIGESQPSSAINITVGMIRPDLPRPHDLEAVPGNGNVDLSFSSPILPEDLVLLNYIIYRYTMGQEPERIATTASLIYTDDTVTNGITYYYTVSALYTNGESGPCEAVNATPTSEIEPFGLPRNLRAKAGSGLVQLTWREPSDERNGSLIGFRIFRSSGGDQTLLKTVDAEIRSYTDSDVVSDTKYVYNISAVYLGGESNKAGPVSATPATTGDVPSHPTSIEAELSNDVVLISWYPPANNGSSAIIEYRIYRWTLGNEPELVGTVGGDTLTFTDDTVSHGESYRYIVSAVNYAGEGDLSLDVMITIPFEEGEGETGGREGLDPIYLAVPIGVLIIVLLAALVAIVRKGGSDIEE